MFNTISSRKERDHTVVLPLYDQTLTKNLRKEHILILSLYDEIMSLAERENYDSLNKVYHKFSVHLGNNLHHKNDQLYPYLRSIAHLRNDFENKVCLAFMSEIKQSTLSIFYSLTQSQNMPVSERNIILFICEFVELRDLLEARFSKDEEIAFPKYHPSKLVIDCNPANVY